MGAAGLRPREEVTPGSPGIAKGYQAVERRCADLDSGFVQILQGPLGQRVVISSNY